MLKPSLTQQLLNLVADDKFALIESIATRPNLFHIVGRTHTETWHSMFLGWLLDPNGSHNLKEFSLRRLLVALTNPTIIGSRTKIDHIAQVASIGQLESSIVLPNEFEQKEFICSAGRIDIFISNILCNSKPDTVILIEQKVDAPLNKKQCKRYADWLEHSFPDYLKIPVLIAPSDRLGISSEDTIGDSRWYGIDYQILHDIVLVPISRHPDLNEQTSPLIKQYIDALRIPINGRKLAVTDEEKELALELYEKHRTAFEAISAALEETTDISLESTMIARRKTALKIKCDGDIIKGESVPELYQTALKYILDNALPIDDIIPYSTSNKRYLVDTKPIHPGGNSFRMPVDHNGYYIEAHKSRKQAIKDLARLFTKLGKDVKIVSR